MSDGYYDDGGGSYGQGGGPPMGQSFYGGQMALPPINPQLYMLMNPQAMFPQRQMAYGQSLMGQAADVSPLRSPWQAAARAMAGVLGGYELGQGQQAAVAQAAQWRQEAAASDLAWAQRRAQAQQAAAPQQAQAPQTAPTMAALPPTTGPAAVAPVTKQPLAVTAPKDLDPIFDYAAKQSTIPKSVLVGLASYETDGKFNSDATSPKGAKGVMQIMPDTARQPGYGLPSLGLEDRSDNTQAIPWGANYLQALGKKLFGDKFDPNDYDMLHGAVQAYNPGQPDYADQVFARAGMTRPAPKGAAAPTQVAAAYPPGTPPGVDMTTATTIDTGAARPAGAITQPPGQAAPAQQAPSPWDDAMSLRQEAIEDYNSGNPVRMAKAPMKMQQANFALSANRYVTQELPNSPGTFVTIDKLNMQPPRFFGRGLHGADWANRIIEQYGQNYGDPQNKAQLIQALNTNNPWKLVTDPNTNQLRYVQENPQPQNVPDTWTLSGVEPPYPAYGRSPMGRAQAAAGAGAAVTPGAPAAPPTGQGPPGAVAQPQWVTTNIQNRIANDQKTVDAYNTSVGDPSGTLARSREITSLLQEGARTGAGANWRLNVGNWLKNNLGWDQGKIESHTQTNTDATATLQQALKDMESQGESQTTRNAIQGADLSLQTPEATINAINQHQKYMALYKSQKATAMGNYLTARTNEAYAGKPYKGMYNFEDDFAKDFPVQVFVAAAGATSGQPFSVWSKGLTDQQKGQVMQLVLNTEGKGTQISMPAEKADEKGNRPDTMRPITPGKIGTLPPTNPDFGAQ